MDNMKTISINPPVETITIGKYPALIFEIAPDDIGDGIGGRVFTPGAGDIIVAWNDCGMCRNSPESCNLDPRRPEVAKVVEQLKQVRS